MARQGLFEWSSVRLGLAKWGLIVFNVASWVGCHGSHLTAIDVH